MKINTRWIPALALGMGIAASAAEPVALREKLGLTPEGSSALLERLTSVSNRFEKMSEQDRLEHFSYRDIKGNYQSLARTTAPIKPKLWGHQDLTTDQVPGTSTERAYGEIAMKAPASPVIVAVLDSGVDIRHKDLQGKIWENAQEVNGVPGVDDDRNGYIDDKYGWNFLGSQNGRNIIANNLEFMREIRRLRIKRMRKGLSTSDIALLDALEARLEKDEDRMDAAKGLSQLMEKAQDLEAAVAVLKALGLTEETVDAVNRLPASTDPMANYAKEIAIEHFSKGITVAVLRERVRTQQLSNYIHFDPSFEASHLIGDRPRKLDEVGYGNPDVSVDRDFDGQLNLAVAASAPSHGTHVAGIIAANRASTHGIAGHADHVRIMAIRAVPDGDERDKDVANGVRYAVDNGAKIINMSFGKDYSPDKKYVDEAFAYAESKGVLLVHAAGNSAKNNDDGGNFPNATTLAQEAQAAREIGTWLEVGASSSATNIQDRFPPNTVLRGLNLKALPAFFSNYGKSTVSLFAPGYQIESTVPQNKYAAFSGTSMASPTVAGVAALVWSQYPNLTARELKDILMASTQSFAHEQVMKPGIAPFSERALVPFSDLSVTGGIVNALKALQLAGS